MQQDVAVKRYV